MAMATATATTNRSLDGRWPTLRRSMPPTPSFEAPQPDFDAPRSVRDFCLRILERGDLATKLAAPLDAQGNPLPDTPSGPAVEIERPTRGPGLRMGGGSDRLARPGLLRDPEHRRRTLSRFAHHELQAVEYFAWALVRWPDLPVGLRRGLLSALVDEQRHCRLYLDRLEASGGRFETDDHSDYFWRQAPVIAASPAGPRAFLAAMGLTLEQANLDFTLTYRDGFADAGDAESAAVCQQVHDDEIAHVALAARWLTRLTHRTRLSDFDQSESEAARPERAEHGSHASGSSPPTDEAAALPADHDLADYLAAVPFPLGPARAKGRRFEVGPRRRAGLSEALIEHVRVARSNPERAGATRSTATDASDGSKGEAEAGDGARRRPRTGSGGTAPE